MRLRDRAARFWRQNYEKLPAEANLITKVSKYRTPTSPDCIINHERPAQQDYVNHA